MIGTPLYDGKIDVWYVNSLTNTLKIAPERGVEILPMWVSYDALLQRARNDTIQLALETGVDALVWIDGDIEWQPEWFYKLVESPHEVIGGTYPKKADNEEYVVRQLTRNRIDDDGLLEVDGLGTGFVKMGKLAMQHLWDVSTPYVDLKDGKERRMIFDVVINSDGLMVSEDIHAFNKLRAAGYKVYLDTSMTCNHTGPKKWKGDFNTWYNKVSPTQPRRPTKQL